MSSDDDDIDDDDWLTDKEECEAAYDLAVDQAIDEFRETGRRRTVRRHKCSKRSSTEPWSYWE